MIKNLAILFIKLYQRCFSILIGPRCRFVPSCSHYSVECFESFPAHLALWYSVRRICKCHPFHPGGFDPVSELRSSQKE